jgi:hypothetical protein
VKSHGAWRMGHAPKSEIEVKRHAPCSVPHANKS